MKHDIFKDDVDLFTDSFYCSYEGAGAAFGAWLSANAGYIASAAAATASVVSTVSQVQQTAAAAAQDKVTAAQTIEAARFEEHVERKRGESIVAKQKAQFSASGFDVDSGTPLELTMDSAFNSELNALQIRKQGQYDADFLQTRARRSKAAIPGMIFGGIANAAAYGGGASRNKPPAPRTSIGGIT